MKKITAVFDDPGGGLAVCSVLEELRNKNITEVSVYSGRLSERIAGGFNLKKINSVISEEEADEILNKEIPDLILTATSGGNAEQMMRNRANSRNIKSVVILDFWKDYKRRWLYSDYDLSEMKDKVCIMDELTKNEMTEEGFPKDKLIVTGHPYLDKIFNIDFKINVRKEIRQNDRLKILFLSQPLEVIGVSNYNVHPLELLSEALADYSLAEKIKIEVKVKLHPVEKNSDELKAIVEKYSSEASNMKTEFTNEDIRELIENADIVIGYNTIAMFESRALGKRTISLKAAPVKNSLTKAMDEAGIEITGIKKDEIVYTLKNKKEINQAEKIFSGGIENCVNVIRQELYPA